MKRIAKFHKVSWEQFRKDWVDTFGEQPEEKIREILHTDSSSKKSLNKIGLYNVNQRICLTYGEKYAVHIDSKVGCFTKVTVRIPAQNAAGEAQK